ncbi:MAG: PAS domain S-box protein, partial [Dehalococcoidia bacterium]
PLAWESAELHHLVIHHASDIVVVTDTLGVVQFVSPSVEATLGFRPADLTGKDVTVLVHPEDDPAVRAAFADMVTEGRPDCTVTFRLRHRDGSWRSIEAVGANLLHAPDVRGIAVIGRDLSERLAAERALRASEERYRDLVENAHDIIYTHDSNGAFTSANHAAEAATGYQRRDLLSMNFRQLLPPDQRVLAQVMLQRKLDGRDTRTTYELDVLAKGGSRLTLEVSTRLIRENGQPAGVQGIARDISARRRTEEAMRQSEERFRGAFEAGPIGMAIADLDCRLLQVNDALIRMSGYEEAELTASDFPRLTHPEDRASAAQLVADVISGRAPRASLEVRCVCKDGTTIWTNVTGAALHGRDGVPQYLLLMVENVTERRNLHERLMRQAFHDPLTGLPNRRLFMDRLEHALTALGRRGPTLAVLFLDLDGFKAANAHARSPTKRRRFPRWSRRGDACSAACAPATPSPAWWRRVHHPPRRHRQSRRRRARGRGADHDTSTPPHRGEPSTGRARRQYRHHRRRTR